MRPITVIEVLVAGQVIFTSAEWPEYLPKRLQELWERLPQATSIRTVEYVFETGWDHTLWAMRPVRRHDSYWPKALSAPEPVKEMA